MHLAEQDVPQGRGLRLRRVIALDDQRDCIVWILNEENASWTSSRSGTIREALGHIAHAITMIDDALDEHSKREAQS